MVEPNDTPKPRFCKHGHDTEECGRTKEGACRECVRIRRAAWWQANAEKGRARNAAWTAANAERRRAYNAAYYAANVERERARVAAYRSENPERWRVAAAAYAAANPEKIRARSAAHYAANREKIIAEAAAYRVANPDKIRARKAARRARKLAAPGRFTEADIKAIIARQKGRCAECKRRRKLTVDHIIPLARGGSNHPGNLQGLCQPCNSRKGAKDPIIFAQQQGRLL
jgi:5-methylcytosine-specific restriction endonuclease McrA